MLSNQYQMRHFYMRNPGAMVLLAFMTISFQYALAAFVDGVERFDGTVKDTATWEEFTTVPGCSVSQDDRLIFKTGFGSDSIDYTTKNVTVGIGELVTVELFPTEGAGHALMYLTNNSSGHYTHMDSAHMSILYSHIEPYGFYDFGASAVFPGGWVSDMFAADIPRLSLADPFILQIERTSRTSATFSAFNSDMSLIGSTGLSFTDMPDDLYISLGAVGGSGGPVAFDNVTIVPEPATDCLVLLGSLALRARRRA